MIRISPESVRSSQIDDFPIGFVDDAAVELRKIDARRPLGGMPHAGADHRQRRAAVAGQRRPRVPGHVKGQRLGDSQQLADFTDEFVQLALLLTIGAVAVVGGQDGQHVGRIAVVAVDDFLQGRFDAQGKRLACFFAPVGQHSVTDIAFAQVDHVDERHAPGVETEHEKIARQRIFGMQGRKVGTADPPERLARQGALAGRHLPDMPAVERIAAGCDEAAPVRGLVVDGPQVAHVEHDAVCPQSSCQKPSFVTFEPFGGKLFGRQLASAHIPDEHTVGHPVVCSRTVPPRPFALPDVACETGDKIREGFVAGRARKYGLPHVSKAGHAG